MLLHTSFIVIIDGLPKFGHTSAPKVLASYAPALSVQNSTTYVQLSGRGSFFIPSDLVVFLNHCGLHLATRGLLVVPHMCGATAQPRSLAGIILQRNCS